MFLTGEMMVLSISDVHKMILSHLVRFLALSKEYRNVITLRAHLLLEAKFHSADTEYLISIIGTL